MGKAFQLSSSAIHAYGLDILQASSFPSCHTRRLLTPVLFHYPQVGILNHTLSCPFFLASEHFRAVTIFCFLNILILLSINVWPTSDSLFQQSRCLAIAFTPTLPHKLDTLLPILFIFNHIILNSSTTISIPFTISHPTTLRHATPRHTTPRHTVPRHVTSRHTTPHHAISGRATTHLAPLQCTLIP
ncbi:unnamed protein product [Protopolystoma xenopodis]|uniref:Uncharacterized protein n=1 Tax=Protopolystoma xenopodis TaxID=117903 RepID=A0A448WD73_9PLAT|nr:unnamed protein product [Protopolystoma xenopodis]